MGRCTLAHAVLAFLCVIGMFNYIDRGIITGAPKEFGSFVSDSLGVPSSNQGTYLGLMTSAFVGCYSIASVSYGHAIHIYPKFLLLCVGLAIWVAALFLSGLAYYLPKVPAAFYFFLSARALSGVGEAAFQCIVPPYVEDFAPAGRKSLWLSLFYTAIPTGTALGYLYGAKMANSAGGWGLAYLAEAAVMAPFVVASRWLPSAEKLVATLEKGKQGAEALLEAEAAGGAAEQSDAVAAVALASLASERPVSSTENSVNAAIINESSTTEASPSFMTQLRYVLCCPAYVLLLLGYAAFTGTTIGISSFGPLFMIALGLDDNEEDASFLFGLVVAFAGVLGTPLGGVLVDTASRRLRATTSQLPRAIRPLHEARVIVCVIWLQISVGAALLVACAATAGDARSKLLFLGLLFGGVFFTFGSSAGISRAVMLLVPHNMRAFAISVQVLGIHCLGDVPSPVIVGYLKDVWAPKCGIVWLNGTSHLDERCKGSAADQQGLVDVLLCANLWMLISVFTWAAAVPALTVQIRKRAKEVAAEGGSDQ